MAISNLRIALERKYKDWLGEKRNLEREIEEICEAWRSLDEKRERLERVDKLVDCTAVVMSELAPDWDASKMTPTTKWATKQPFDVGDVTRFAMDIMRREGKPMKSRTIAKQVAKEQGLDPKDTDLVSRMKQAIDSSFRKKIGKFIGVEEGYARLYYIIDHGDRPKPSDQSDSR